MSRDELFRRAVEAFIRNDQDRGITEAKRYFKFYCWSKR
jgi:hypothetical protein